MQQNFLKNGQVVILNNPDDFEPIRLNADVFRKLKWLEEGAYGGSTGSDYIFSKRIGKIKLVIRTVDYDNYWHVTDFPFWGLKVMYLHELQFLWYLIFRTELDVY